VADRRASPGGPPPSGKLEGESDELDARLQAAAREFITRLFVLVKTGQVFDVSNARVGPRCEQGCRDRQPVRDATDGVAALQFLEDGTFLNRTLVKLDAAALEQAQTLTRFWTPLGVGEVAAIDETTAEDWRELLAALKRIAAGAGGSLVQDQAFPRIRLRDVKATLAASAEVVVTERFRALRVYGVLAVTLKSFIGRVQAGKPAQVARVRGPSRSCSCGARFGGAPPLAVCAAAAQARAALPLTNCVVYATVVGAPLGLAPGELCELAMGAAFHDLVAPSCSSRPRGERLRHPRGAAPPSASWPESGWGRSWPPGLQWRTRRAAG